MSEKGSGTLLWEVELPERGAAPLGARKRRGTVVIGCGEDEERIAVPLAVARALSAKRKHDEVHPSSRSELRYQMGDVARSCARARIEGLIDRREYASDEVRRKLREDGYEEATIDACVARAQEVGLVSDQRFADNFVHSKLAAGWGELRIRRELARRGIEAQELPGWPYAYFDPEDEVTRATELARRHVRPGKNAYERLVRYLCGRGFSLGVATRAARSALEDEGQPW